VGTLRGRSSQANGGENAGHFSRDSNVISTTNSGQKFSGNSCVIEFWDIFSDSDSWVNLAFFFLVFLEFGHFFWDIFFIGNFLPLTLGHFRCMHGIPESDQDIFLVNNVFDNGNACVHCMIGCLVRCSKKNIGRQVQYRTVRKFGFCHTLATLYVY